MAEINEFLSPKAEQQIKEYIKVLGKMNTEYSSIATSLDKLNSKSRSQEKNETKLTALEKERIRVAQQTKKVFAQNLAAEEKATKTLILGQERLKIARKKSREEAQKQLGVIKKSGGLFRSVTKSILAASAAMLGFQAVLRVLKSAGTLIRAFQKENAVLAGVLNKTRKEITALTKDAERLGSTTAKTAKEVTSLQIAYARLGFTQEEILQLTGDTIDGSIALNAELAATAELTGAVIRSFDDLKTSDADKVLDILTASTQNTALNFEKLQVAIPIVSGAASAAKVPFTTMIAQLGQAADRGIDASTSATSLRNIYIELSKKGLTLDQALKKINSSQDRLSAANDLFGKRAAVTALALASTTDKTKELDKALQDSGGTAERVAKEQLATLDGSIKLLTSAWEGFILSIEDGEGVIARFVNGTLKTFANALIELSNLDLIFTRTGKLTLEQITRTYDALIGLNNKQGNNFRKFVEEYEDVSTQWLAINKDTAIEFLKELDFSNKEAELLYTEHLRRLVNQEITAFNASQNQSEAVDTATDAIGRQNEAIRKLDKKSSELNDTWEAIINKYGVETAIAFKESHDEIEKQQLNVTDSIKSEWDKRLEIQKEALKKMLEDEQLYNDTKRQLTQQNIDSIAGAANIIFDIENTQRMLAIEGEEDGSKKKQELLIQQAKAERNQALFTIGVTTLQRGLDIQAQAALLASNPVTAPLAINAYAQLGLLIASSGVAAAAVASRPLPEFYKGTDNAPSTFIAGDKYGRELIAKKDGSVELSPDQATIYSGNEYKGASIIPNSQTENILRGGGNGSDTRMLNELRLTRKAIENSTPNIRFSRNVPRLNTKHLNRKYGIN